MRFKLMFSIILVVVTLTVFAKTANHQFINFDDTGYVTTNPVVKGGLTASGIAWAFTATAMSNWHPLTWLSHMADVQMFGLNPRGHHLTSVVIHALSGLLLFLLLVRITGAPWQSFSVAALFALHPLHVESVAWVAERKDVLSCLFMLLSLHFYAGYVKKPGYRPYLCSLLAFVAGLMSKPMLVTLPLVMLLLDYWPFNRFARDEAAGETGAPSGGMPLFFALVREKTPFFLFSALSAAITIYGQHEGGAMATLAKIPVVLRITNALIAYVKYIGLMFWPQELAILYPFPRWLSYSQAIAAGVLLLVISVMVVRFRRRYPYLVTGWFWYLVTLLPVIGLIQVGGQSMADRYTYIPLTGLFIACCWLASDLTQGWRWRRAILGTVGGLAISVLTAVTWHQLDYWKDSISICRHTLAVTSDNYLITNNYGIALDERGDHAGAYRLFQETLLIFPGSATAYANLGAICVRWGRFDEAIGYYDKALALAPDHAIARSGLGKA
ncbi:MAG: tetratricopeptide repeat protein, partial [Geobacteraceae bacterium]